MAKAQFIKSARKDIYHRGKQVEYVSKRGKRAGQTLTKIDRTQPCDDKDEILIHKGEGYWTWSFMYGGTYYSKTAPRQSQLTQNEYKQTIYSLQEEIDDWKPSETDEAESFVDEVRGEIEDLKEQQEEKLDNMPEQLQDSDAGQTLQERIDNLDDVLCDIDSIDTDYDSFDWEDAPDDSDKELTEEQEQEKRLAFFDMVRSAMQELSLDC